MKRLILSLALISLSLTSFAATAASNNSWQFQIVPYVWALNLNGNVTVNGATANVDQTFGDILRDLNVGGMLVVSASKNNWTFALNGLYAQTSANENVGPFTAKIQNDFAIFTPTVAYDAYRKNFSNSALTISPYVGARVTVNNAKLTIDNITLSENENWTDPLIGAKINYNFARNWSVLALASIGGTSTNTDYSYDASGFIGYNPQSLKSATFYGGYQYLRQKYTTGSGAGAFAWNMKLFGPLVGVAINF